MSYRNLQNNPENPPNKTPSNDQFQYKNAYKTNASHKIFEDYKPLTPRQIPLTSVSNSQPKSPLHTRISQNNTTKPKSPMLKRYNNTATSPYEKSPLQKRYGDNFKSTNTLPNYERKTYDPGMVNKYDYNVNKDNLLLPRTSADDYLRGLNSYNNRHKDQNSYSGKIKPDQNKYSTSPYNIEKDNQNYSKNPQLNWIKNEKEKHKPNLRPSHSETAIPNLHYTRDMYRPNNASNNLDQEINSNTTSFNTIMDNTKMSGQNSSQKNQSVNLDEGVKIEKEIQNYINDRRDYIFNKTDNYDMTSPHRKSDNEKDHDKSVDNISNNDSLSNTHSYKKAHRLHTQTGAENLKDILKPTYERVYRIDEFGNRIFVEERQSTNKSRPSSANKSTDYSKPSQTHRIISAQPSLSINKTEAPLSARDTDLNTQRTSETVKDVKKEKPGKIEKVIKKKKSSKLSGSNLSGRDLKGSSNLSMKELKGSAVSLNDPNKKLKNKDNKKLVKKDLKVKKNEEILDPKKTHKSQKPNPKVLESSTFNQNDINTEEKNPTKYDTMFDSMKNPKVKKPNTPDWQGSFFPGSKLEQHSLQQQSSIIREDTEYSSVADFVVKKYSDKETNVVIRNLVEMIDENTHTFDINKMVSIDCQTDLQNFVDQGIGMSSPYNNSIGVGQSKTPFDSSIIQKHSIGVGQSKNPFDSNTIQQSSNLLSNNEETFVNLNTENTHKSETVDNDKIKANISEPDWEEMYDLNESDLRQTQKNTVSSRSDLKFGSMMNDHIESSTPVRSNFTNSYKSNKEQPLLKEIEEVQIKSYEAPAQQIQRKEDFKKSGIPIDAFEDYTESIEACNNRLRSRLSTVFDVNEDLFESLRSDNKQKMISAYLKASTNEKAMLRSENSDLKMEVEKQKEKYIVKTNQCEFLEQQNRDLILNCDEMGSEMKNVERHYNQLRQDNDLAYKLKEDLQDDYNRLKNDYSVKIDTYEANLKELREKMSVQNMTSKNAKTEKTDQCMRIKSLLATEGLNLIETNENEFTILNTLKNNLESKISDQKSINETDKSTIKKLLKENNEFKESNQNQQCDYEEFMKLQKRYELLEKEKGNLEDQNVKLEENVQELQNSNIANRNLLTENISMNNQMRFLKQENQNLQTENSTKEKTNLDLKKENENFTKILEDNQKLRDRVNTTSEELNILREKNSDIEKDSKEFQISHNFYKRKYEEVYIIYTEHMFFNNLGEESDIKGKLEKNERFKLSIREVMEKD